GNEVVDKAIFDFTVTLPGLNTQFTLDFNGLQNSGLNLPVIKGTFNITEGVSFETQYDLNTTAFTLNNAVATTTFNASATIPDQFKIGFGLLSVETTSA